jgi:5-methylthioadenosine/S-adenosylhomocysteine deaminase
VLSIDQLIDLATSAGGRFLGLPIGQLKPGYKADFVVLDTDDLSLQPLDTLKSNIVHAISDQAIKHVFCGGQQVVRDGRLALVNQADLVRRIAALATT